MKQLEQAVSSPWEIKESGPKNQTPTQWTELTEEQQKTQQKKETEEQKATCYTYFLEFPPFGSHILPGCKFEERPPESIMFPLMQAVEARMYRGESPEAHMVRTPTLHFKKTSVCEPYVWYRFTRMT